MKFAVRRLGIFRKKCDTLLSKPNFSRLIALFVPESQKVNDENV